MNPWEIFLNIVTWVGLMVALFIVFVVAWLILEGLWKALIKGMLERRRNLEQYLLEARTIAQRYRDDTTPEFREGFLAGVRWGWGYFTRIRKPNS